MGKSSAQQRMCPLPGYEIPPLSEQVAEVRITHRT
jgi:hypothetical protein